MAVVCFLYVLINNVAIWASDWFKGNPNYINQIRCHLLLVVSGWVALCLSNIRLFSEDSQLLNLDINVCVGVDTQAFKPLLCELSEGTFNLLFYCPIIFLALFLFHYNSSTYIEYTFFLFYMLPVHIICAEVKAFLEIIVESTLSWCGSHIWVGIQLP